MNIASNGIRLHVEDQGRGLLAKADPALVTQFETIVEPLVVDYRKGAVDSFEAITA